MLRDAVTTARVRRQIFYAACRNGNPRQMSRAFQKIGNADTVLCQEAFSAVLESKRSSAVLKVYRLFSRAQLHSLKYSSAFLQIARNGSLEALQTLLAECLLSPEQLIEFEKHYAGMVVQAAAGGHLEMLRWLLEDPKASTLRRNVFEQALVGASARSSLPLVQFLLSDPRTQPKIRAAEIGRVAVACITRHDWAQLEFLLQVAPICDELLDRAQLLRYQVPRDILEHVASLAYGRELPDDCDPVGYLQSMPRLPNARLTELLISFAVPTAQRKPYYLAAACRHAAESRLLRTLAELNCLLDAPTTKKTRL